METLFSLNDQNIVITGASSGIGKQCAITCAQMGANVVLVDRNKERLYQTFQQLTPGNHLYFSCDITEYNYLEAIVEESVSKIGKICGFVHSAGSDVLLPLRNMKPQYYEKLFCVNVIAGFELAKILSKKNTSESKTEALYSSLP